MRVDNYLRGLKRAITNIVKEQRGSVVVVHHNDADGLSSAAIILEALRRRGVSVVNIPLERVHPLIINRIVEKHEGVIMFVDLGAGAAPEISRINAGRNTVVIIDHHYTPGVDDPKLINLSTELYGISGDKDISTSSAAYLFAKLLSESNKDLAFLGVIGAIGDSHHRFGRLESVNRQILLEAVNQGQVVVESLNGKERYYLTTFGGKLNIDSFAKNLTTLGAVGYLMNGPDIAIKALLKGPDEEFEEALSRLDKLKRERFTRAIRKLEKQGLKRSGYLQWFHVYDEFSPMGVKSIGEFCMEIRNSEFVDKNLYLAGVQNMPREVPRLGRFDWDIVKVSFRLPSVLEERVSSGDMPGYDYIVPRAASYVAGDIDACHGYACATTFRKGLEDTFVEYFNIVVESYLKKKGGRR